MKTPFIVLRAVASCLPLGLTVPALAACASVPPEGATTYVTNYAGRVIDVATLGDGASETLVEATGVSRNALGQPVFDNMRARCLVLSRVIGGESSNVAGACSETDSDGDIVFTSFEGDAHNLIGGTGKYKGISGSARYSLTPEASEPGRIAYSVKQDVIWTIR
jgi:hypothetical protein